MTYLKVTCRGYAPTYFAIANDGQPYCWNESLGAFKHPYTVAEMKDYFRREAADCKVTVGPRTATEAAAIFADRAAWFKKSEYMGFANAMADEYSALA